MIKEKNAFFQDTLEKLGIPGIIRKIARTDIDFLTCHTKAAVQIALDCIMPTVIITGNSKIITAGQASSLPMAFDNAMKSNPDDAFMFIFNRRIDNDTAGIILKYYKGGVIIAPETSIGFHNCHSFNLADKYNNFTVIELMNGDTRKGCYELNYLKNHTDDKLDENILECFRFVWPFISKINPTDPSFIFSVRKRILKIWRPEGPPLEPELICNKLYWENPIIASSNIKLTAADVKIIKELGGSALIQPEKYIVPDVVEAAIDYGLILCSSK